MKNITQSFRQGYHPKSALIIYQHSEEDHDFYVESLDIIGGRLMNAHPLSLEESRGLATALAEGDKQQTFLQSEGFLPKNVLYVNPSFDGTVIWHTPARKEKLLFKDETIPSGTAYVPALLWKAKGKTLQLFALASNRRPGPKTQLYLAPFMNTNTQGGVCMGTVDTEMSKQISLEQYIKNWQHFFWNSYFTHFFGSGTLAKVNIIELWRELIETGKKFPIEVLHKSRHTFNNLLR